jgi:hypothetical protein
MSMQIDWGVNMVLPEYIDEILIFVQYGNNKNGSCCMEEVGARTKCFDIWWVKPQEWFYHSCIPWYVYPDMSDALKGYEHSYDDRWTIVRIFLCTFEEVRICSVCRSDKWFIVTCYIGFITYTDKI